MSPGQILQALLKLDPKAARVLLAAIGALAVVAVVLTWRLDLQQALWMALYIILLGAAVVLVAETVTNPKIRAAFGWFTTVLLITVVLAFVISAVFPRHTPFAPTACMVKFWENCDIIFEHLAEKQPRRVPDQPIVTRPTTDLSVRASCPTSAPVRRT